MNFKFLLKEISIIQELNENPFVKYHQGKQHQYLYKYTEKGKLKFLLT